MRQISNFSMRRLFSFHKSKTNYLYRKILRWWLLTKLFLLLSWSKHKHIPLWQKYPILSFSDVLVLSELIQFYLKCHSEFKFYACSYYNFWLPAACGGAALGANITLLVLTSFTQYLLFCLLYHCLALAEFSIGIA